MKHILVIGALLLLGTPALADDVPRFTDWGPTENLGSPINGPYLESCVSISKNGLSLYFSSNRQTGNPASTDRDLYVSKRATKDEPWGEPEPLTMLNTTVWDSCPALGLDEHRFYFTSLRPGGCGGHDVWVSHRKNRKDDLGWEEPVNLGCAPDGVNSDASDLFPTFFEDETGRVLMYFGSTRAGTSGPMDLYQSEMNGDGTFGPATPLVELNSPAMEHSVTVRRDGLEVIFGSTRVTGKLSFWTATRASTSEPWSAPVPVESLPAGGSGRYALSFDGRELYFAGALPGASSGLDIWVARREKLK
jgi:hypothetical protein